MGWQFQDAKNNLDQLVKAAQSSGPQVITVRGKDAAVVLSISDFRHLTQKKGNLAEFFRNSPLYNSELKIERSQDSGRDITL